MPIFTAAKDEKYFRNGCDFGQWQQLCDEHYICMKKTSSVKVKPGCTLKLFENSNNVGLLDTLTADASFLSDRPSNSDNKVSSLSCICKGMIFLMSLFESLHCVLEALKSFEVDP